MALIDSTASPSPPGWAIASGALLAALLNKLVETDTLSGGEVRQIISEAKVGIDQFGTHMAHRDAVLFLDTIGKNFAGK